MKLRRATMQDAEMLLEWRNDELTRANSLNSDVVALKSHLKWLERSLSNLSVAIFIAEVDSVPVGTCRFNTVGDIYELSWTIAPQERGKGYGKQMVAMAIGLVKCDIIAQIKPDNAASIAVAKANGFELEAHCDSAFITRYRRKYDYQTR